MFYSHQILQNSEHGVATIWIAASFGKSAQKKLSKKAIQQVNVPKACETILEPGPPLALRLQGTLLYGVSKVFLQQCGYVLTDAEKIQSDMISFFRTMQSGAIDIQNGKTKRSTITLQDDPDFDLSSQLPPFDLLGADLSWCVPSQGSAGNFSQMTPQDVFHQMDRLPRRQASLISIDLPSSSHSTGSYQLPSELYKNSSPCVKGGNNSVAAEFMPFFHDAIEPLSGLGLDFDGDGNLVTITEPEADQELPAFPGLETHQSTGSQEPEQQQDAQLQIGDPFLFDIPILPDAEAFPKIASKEHTLFDTTMSEDTEETNHSAVVTKRKRTVKAFTAVDDKIYIARSEIRNWNSNYIAAMTELKTRRDVVSKAQAKTDAAKLVIEQGIANVGFNAKSKIVSSKLAAAFAGWPLITRVQGREPDEDQVTEPQPRSRRRKADEAFLDEPTIPERNIRVNPGAQPEISRATFNKEGKPTTFEDESFFELGMDAATPMKDHHSSSLMPWSQPGSVAPSSSIRDGQGSAQKSTIAPSPLFSRSNSGILASLERRSEPRQNSCEPLLFAPQNPSIKGEASAQSQLVASQEGLDIASQEFLQYAITKTLSIGSNNQWIEFEQLAHPESHAKAIAAQAFIHVLSLASRNLISVQQVGRDENIPFGPIHIGIAMDIGGLE